MSYFSQQLHLIILPLRPEGFELNVWENGFERLGCDGELLVLPCCTQLGGNHGSG